MSDRPSTSGGDGDVTILATRSPPRPTEPLTEVWFEETGERRDVVRYCGRCSRGPAGGEEIEIVSPTGVAHCQRGDEFTLCGINATGLDWWWRL